MQRKDVTIHAPTARGSLSMTQVVKDSILFDPERPHMGPNELLREIGNDPTKLMFNCPFCHKDMNYDLFVAHIPNTVEGKGCLTRNWGTVDVTNRRFSGASVGEQDG